VCRDELDRLFDTKNPNKYLWVVCKAYRQLSYDKR
jgi:hypothetical protein